MTILKKPQLIVNDIEAPRSGIFGYMRRMLDGTTIKVAESGVKMSATTDEWYLEVEVS